MALWTGPVLEEPTTPKGVAVISIRPKKVGDNVRIPEPRHEDEKDSPEKLHP
jgi:hypothetical protein